MSGDYRQKCSYGQRLLYCAAAVFVGILSYQVVSHPDIPSEAAAPVGQVPVSTGERTWLEKRFTGAQKRLDRAKRTLESVFTGNDAPSSDAPPAKQSLDSSLGISEPAQK